MTLSEVSVFIEPQHALRKLYTRRASFGRSLIDRINPATGRVHGSLILYGAKTGRFASSEPNLQNRPRPRFDNAGREVENVRRSWVAPPGRVIVAADEGQAELRTAATIAAGISRHSAMRDSIAAGVDVHKRNAAAINGIAESAVTKAQRQTGKAVWFGLLYGQSARGLRQFAYASYGVDMTHHEAENARSTFFRLYPELTYWQRRQARESEAHGYVTTAGGRLHRWQWESPPSFRFNVALNFPISGVVAEIGQVALTHIDRDLRPLPGNARLVNQVHDEYLVECDEDPAVVAEVSAVMETAITAAFRELLPTAPTFELVEATSGWTWADAK